MRSDNPRSLESRLGGISRLCFMIDTFLGCILYYFAHLGSTVSIDCGLYKMVFQSYNLSNITFRNETQTQDTLPVSKRFCKLLDLFYMINFGLLLLMETHCIKPFLFSIHTKS